MLLWESSRYAGAPTRDPEAVFAYRIGAYMATPPRGFAPLATTNREASGRPTPAHAVQPPSRNASHSVVRVDPRVCGVIP